MRRTHFKKKEKPKQINIFCSCGKKLSDVDFFYNNDICFKCALKLKENERVSKTSE